MYTRESGYYNMPIWFLLTLKWIYFSLVIMETVAILFFISHQETKYFSERFAYSVIGISKYLLNAEKYYRGYSKY